MILKELTPKQTTTWLDNLDKLANLYNKCQEHYRETIEHRRDILKNVVLKSKWKRFRFGIDSWYDIHHYWDGTFRVFGSLGNMPIVKDLPATSEEFIDLKYHINEHWIDGENRKQYVSKLIKKWGKYAKQPFQIDGADLEDYFKVLAWHEELKELALKEGIYDEAFNLDEDRL